MNHVQEYSSLLTGVSQQPGFLGVMQKDSLIPCVKLITGVVTEWEASYYYYDSAGHIPVFHVRGDRGDRANPSNDRVV